MKNETRKRIWFWSLFLSAVVAVYIFGIYPRQHILAQARQTVDILSPRLAADSTFCGSPRFTRHERWCFHPRRGWFRL